MEVMRLLLENGAQPDFGYETGSAPLPLAIKIGNVAIIELLLPRGGKVDYLYKVVSEFDWFIITFDSQLTLSSFTIVGCK
jgi:ankyrin repeat protein